VYLAGYALGLHMAEHDGGTGRGHGQEQPDQPDRFDPEAAAS
jgi:hypothetical protein